MHGERRVACAAVDPATLDAWLPEFAVRTRHRRRSPAPPERLWTAANQVCLSETHTLQRDYPRLEGPEDFRAWSEPGTVRVLIANWVDPDGDGSTINSEARVAPVDRRAALRLRSLWVVMRVFERLI